MNDTEHEDADAGRAVAGPPDDGRPLGPPSASEERDAERARRLHERTGEIELIISGALVFGLFQVPGALDRVVQTLMPRLAEGQFIVVFMASFYVRMIVMTLIVAFLLHLVTRAYWVGLIGLDSVFPDGVHWDRIRYGPLAKEVYRTRVRRLSVMARRADDFGSSIFSFAFWISVLFIWSILFGALAGAAWYLVRATVLPELSGVWFFVVVFGLAGVPSVAIGIDKILAGRLAPGGRVAGALRATVAGAYWVTGGPIFMPIQFTLFSRVPKKFIWPLFVGVFGLLIFGYLGVLTVTIGDGRLSGSAIYPPRPGPRTLVDAHYADRRSVTSTEPYIQSAVVRGPYVEVVVPLVALRIEERFRAACPELEPRGRAGLVGGADLTEPADDGYERDVLACFARIWTASLDGDDLAVEWNLRWEDAFGPTALVSYVSTDDLDPGWHVLVLREVPRPAPQEEAAATEANPEPADGTAEGRGPTIRYIRFTL